MFAINHATTALVIKREAWITLLRCMGVVLRSEYLKITFDVAARGIPLRLA